MVWDEQMIADQFTCQVTYQNQEQKVSKHRALRHTAFYITFPREVAAQLHLKSSVP